MSETDERIALELEEKESGGRPYMTRLSDRQIAQAKEFAEEIDVTNRTMVLQYGNAAQRKVSAFTESSLFSIPANDLNEIDADIRTLLKKLREFERDFDNTPDIAANDAKSLSRFKSIYDRFNSALTEAARRLEIHHSSLLRHVSRMDDLYEKCFQIVKEFDMYIYAGDQCLKTQRETTLKQMEAQALKSGFLEDTIRTEDFRQSLQLFEQKLQDLCLSRNLPFQILAQIRLLRQTDITMAASLRRCTADTFPLYRSRVVLSLGLKQGEGNTGRIIDAAVFHEANEDLRKTLNAVRKAAGDTIESRRKGIHF